MHKSFTKLKNHQTIYHTKGPRSLFFRLIGRLVLAEKLKNHTTMSNNYWYLTSLTSVAE